MKKTKNSIFTSAIALLLCVAMLVGTTYAWFTDSAVSSGNVVATGKLDVELHWSDKLLASDSDEWIDGTQNAVFTHNNWEPGYTEIRYIKVSNAGTLNLKWKLTIEADGPVTALAGVIDVYYVNPVAGEITTLDGLSSVGKISEVMAEKTNSTGRLTPGQSAILAIAFHLDETAGNEYQGMSLCDNGFSLKLLATQDIGESDSFGDNYDEDADWDEGSVNFTASAALSEVPLIHGTLASNVTIGDASGISAYLPSGVKVAEGATSLDLAINKVDPDNIIIGEGTAATSLDVHVSGIAADNTVPMIVNLGAILPAGMDDTELKLYHTEDGTPVLMTRVAGADDFAIHNQYTYNAATGEVSIFVASFSVFSAVQANVDKWDGTSDTSWYNENDTEFTLTTAEQFAGFRDLVDGGNTFEGKTVKLGVDVDLDGKLFDPIGYGYAHLDGQVFMGTFDGSGYTVYKLYQNGWELDSEKYTYSTAGGGLFASIKDATIKNLAVSGANIVFECVDIGIVVGYAQGQCHFENIVVTNSKIANYNRATGGVVGEVCYGSYGTDVSKGYSHTFKNVVVDSSVKISSLWGSFDTLCGGVIGGKWGDATVKMEDVIVAAKLDVFSDVTSAYRWYAYRRAGMLIGHTEQNSPKKALNAAAEFLTCERVNVYYGDWVNYTYYEFANQDSATGQRYPWVRAEAGEHNSAFSNPRYGVPTHGGVKVIDGTNSTASANITFGQLYGGGQGVYGCNEHAGVTISDKTAKTVYLINDFGWTDLKLYYWYTVGDDVWTTLVDGNKITQKVDGAYMIEIPAFAHGFTITGTLDGETYTSEVYLVSELVDGARQHIASASVGDKNYLTIQEAIDNTDNGTVTVLGDVELSKTIVVNNGKKITLDLNGNTLDAAFDSTVVEVLLAEENAEVIITGNGTMIASGNNPALVTVNSEYIEVISAIDGAKVMIQNGTFISDGCTTIYATRDAVVSIYNGYFVANDTYYGKYYTLDIDESVANRGQINVYGGTYVNFNPANHTNDGANYTNKLSSCSALTANGNVYTVNSEHNFYVSDTCDCVAEKELYTYSFTFGLNGTNGHKDGTELKDAISYTVGGYTLTLTDMSKVFAGAFDAQNNSCLKLGTQTDTAKFTFVVPDDVKAVTIYVAKYKTYAAKVTVNGDTYTLTKDSDSGEYDEIIIDTATVKTINFTTGAGGDERCMIDAIKFYVYDAKVIEEHSCNANSPISAKDATCTESGLTSGARCDICGKITVPQDETPKIDHTFVVDIAIDATCISTGLTEGSHCEVCGEVETAQQITPITANHSFVDGDCEWCGALDHEHQYNSVVTAPTCTAEGYTTHICTDADCGYTYRDNVTEALGHAYDGEICKHTENKYTMSEYEEGSQYAKNEVHVLDANTTIVTTQCHFTTQLRLYSSSTHNGTAIIKSESYITEIGINAGYKKNVIVVYGSNDEGATWEEAARIDVDKIAYVDYSAVLNGSYKWIMLDGEGTDPTRITSITLITTNN